jgi:hypothetical protein
MRIRDGKHSDPGSRKTSLIRNTGWLVSLPYQVPLLGFACNRLGADQCFFFSFRLSSYEHKMIPKSLLSLPEPFLPAERKKRAAKRKIQEEAEAAHSAAGAHTAESAVAAGSSSGSDRLDHVFAVPKTPSPVPVPAAAATEEAAAAARPRRKAGLRPQKREIAPAPSAEPEVGHSYLLGYLVCSPPWSR